MTFILWLCVWRSVCNKATGLKVVVKIIVRYLLYIYDNIFVVLYQVYAARAPRLVRYLGLFAHTHLEEICTLLTKFENEKVYYYELNVSILIDERANI